MALCGTMVGPIVIIDPEGKPLIEVDAPQPPSGYVLEGSWVDNGSEIIQTWRAVPEEGTAADAVMDLARITFASLPDEQAYEVRALADAWTPGIEYVGPDDEDGRPQSRVLFEGGLYKCLKTHTAQLDWAPDAAPSLWAAILPGQDGGEPGEWVQPGPENAYKKGDRVWHDGKLWESTFDGENVWEPGAVGVGEDIWKDVTEED